VTAREGRSTLLGALPALALTALVAVLFREVLFRGRVFYERDLHLLWWGQTARFVRCLAAGSFPLWDPSIGFGEPVLANPSAQVLYPWTWVSLLLSPFTCYTFYVVSHVLLGGLGLEALARRLGTSRPGALLAACVFVFSGPFLSLVSLWHHLAGAAWIPWVFLAGDRALERPTVARGLVFGAALALQILAGSADMCFMGGLVFAAYSLRYFHLGSAARAENFRRLAVGLGALAFAFGLSAGMWLPAAATALRSARAGLPDSLRTYWSLHPLGLLQTVAPLFAHTLPLAKDVRALLYESREPFLSSVYLGVASLPLVVAALTGRGRGLAFFFAGTAAVAGLVALGRYGVAYDWVLVAFPPIRILRYPVKATILLSFAWALLAGFGFDRWRQRATEEERGGWPLGALAVLLLGSALVWALLLGEARLAAFLDPAASPGDGAAAVATVRRDLRAAGVLSLLALAGVVIGLLGRARATTVAAALGVVAVLDLLLAHDALNPTARRELFAAPPAVLRYLQAANPPRLYVYDYFPRILGKIYRRTEVEVRGEDGPADAPRILKLALATQHYLAAPVYDRWGLQGSYETDRLSLYPKPQISLNLFLRAKEETPGWVRLMRVGAVDYVLARHREGLEDLMLRGSVGTDEPIFVFAVPETRPRTYAVGGARVADGLSALQTLTEPAFDPSREIVLPEGASTLPPATFSGTSRLREFRPDRVRLEVATSDPGFVVLVDAYDPGWSAQVDGRPASVLRANVAFRAVAVPAGRHIVELRYRPTTALLGLGISALTLVAGAAWAFRQGRRPVAGTSP